ncbi:MAG: amino acid ABC transporter permease [Gammaproteobacteria bacterium]|nr:MAG: amino acid ABC transporter permease [Gammaproteobacteria bacterium]
MYPDPDRPRRVGKLDIALLGVLLAVCWYVWTRVSDVLVYRWNWSFLPSVLFRRNEASGGFEPNLLLEGLLTTLKLSLWAMLFASILGMVLGVLATRQRLLARLVAFGYVGLIRNIPPLVFIFVFYFFVSSQLMPALGVDAWARNLDGATASFMSTLLGPPDLLENLISGVICMAMFEAAYIAEIVRAGIQSVPKSQTEAAMSVGLGPIQIFRLVILPQALHAVMPPLANQFILLVKNSAIVSLISVQELTFIGAEIAVSTGRRFETWIVVAVMYFVLCYCLALLFRYLENRSRRALAR